MKKIGITGGIGSGKSIVTQLLDVLGYPIYDSDYYAKWLMHNSEDLRKSLQNEFGDDIYIDGLLNRPKLASIVFADPTRLKTLNSIVHPSVRAHFAQWAQEQTAKLVFIESAIMFDAGLDRLLDEVWVVTAPKEERVARAMARDKSTSEQIEARMGNQMTEEAMIERSQRVIRNGAGDVLLSQIQAILVEF